MAENMAGYIYIAQMGSIYFHSPLARENALPHVIYPAIFSAMEYYILYAFYYGVLISNLLTL